jgi:hypothetical protein
MKGPVFRLLKTLLIILSVSFTGLLYAQNHLENRISFTAQNESLRSILGRLSDETGLNITYNASDRDFDRVISYTARDQKLHDVLNGVLGNIHHTFEQVGNHLVVIPKSDVNNNSSRPNQSKTYNPDLVPERTEDTLPVMENKPPVTQILRDTIFIVDTILRTERLIIRDTVFIERPPARDVTRPSSLLRDLLGVEVSPRERWAVGLSYSQMLSGYYISGNETLSPDLQNVKDADRVSLRNFGLGAAIYYNTGNLSLAGNLGISSYSNRFLWSELFTTGGFNLIDTLDSFFTILQNDTIWTHITDTTWVPLESQEILFDRMNRFGFFEAGVSASWVLISGRNASWFASTGFQAGVPIWLRGQSIRDLEDYPAAEVDRDNFNSWVFAWTAGLGARFRLNPMSDVFAETRYKRYISEWSANHPLDRRMHGIGIRIGLIYYL